MSATATATGPFKIKASAPGSSVDGNFAGVYAGYAFSFEAGADPSVFLIGPQDHLIYANETYTFA